MGIGPGPEHLDLSRCPLLHKNFVLQTLKILHFGITLVARQHVYSLYLMYYGMTNSVVYSVATSLIYSHNDAPSREYSNTGA